MKVLLAGDSWGIGVFENHPVTGYGPIGQGIHTLLIEYGIDVVNISKAGGSNWLMIDRMNGVWDNYKRCSYGAYPDDKINFKFEDIDAIVFLQTDVFREKYTHISETNDSSDTKKKWLDSSLISNLLMFESLSGFIDHYFENMYTALNEVGRTYNKHIYCIGGWSQLHNTISNYSNLIPVIPSATKLLIPELIDDVFLSDPEWFVQLADDDRIMQKFGKELKSMTIEAGTKFDLIIHHWDEVHPNLAGYQKITEALIPYLKK